MPEYRRAKTKGATYFFTVNCLHRGRNGILIENIDHLRLSFRKVKEDHPFKFEAVVVLPDHLHCIWTLPENAADFGKRWNLVKANFSRAIPPGTTEPVSGSRQRRGERAIWQRRFWEHQIRDDRDYKNHVDYIHFNPVKHGYCARAGDWPFSSFHKFVRNGVYPPDWSDDPVHVRLPTAYDN
jgi:putative transposase